VKSLVITTFEKSVVGLNRDQILVADKRSRHLNADMSIDGSVKRTAIQRFANIADLAKI